MLRCAVFFLLTFTSNVFAEPRVTPRYQHFKQSDSAVVQCDFGRTLIDCRLRVSEHWNKNFDSVLDFSLGARSPTVPLEAATASYAGSGLSNGQCGVSLRVRLDSIVLVECHGRTEDGQWSRGIALLTANDRPLNTTSVHHNIVTLAKPGTDLSLLLQAQGRLDTCIVETPEADAVFMSPGDVIPTGSRYRLHGAGALQGECGATLTNVQQRDAGVWHSYGYTLNQDLAAWQVMVVLVEDATVGNPELQVINPESLQAGQRLTATCRTPPSVPPMKLIWLLDDEVVRSDDSNNTLPGDVDTSRPWRPRAVIQTYSRVLTARDLGKRLECRAEHPAVEGFRSAYHELPGADEVGCPLLATHSVHVRCSLAGAEVDCVSAAAPPGSTAMLECRPGFKPRGNHKAFYITNCNGRRRWDPVPITCDLDCGRRISRATQLSAGGTEAQQSEFPWHVAVFRKEGPLKEDPFQPICGGSLVTLKFFISAAHCFWDNAARAPLSASLHKASLGKHTLSWDVLDDTEQRHSIKTIHLPLHFAGNSKRLESDIALVQLKAPVEVTSAVNVVCMDWKTTFEHRQLTNNSLGTVPGWGLTENNTQSATLRFVELPFVPFAECSDSVPLAFRDYLVRDKMCGGYRGRTTSVCKGDSGGGFVFPEATRETQRYYLRGVVSSSPGREGAGNMLCQAEHRTAFTLVSVFVKWIEGIVLAPNNLDEDDY